MIYPKFPQRYLAAVLFCLILSLGALGALFVIYSFNEGRSPLVLITRTRDDGENMRSTTTAHPKLQMQQQNFSINQERAQKNAQISQQQSTQKNSSVVDTVSDTLNINLGATNVDISILATSDESQQPEKQQHKLKLGSSVSKDNFETIYIDDFERPGSESHKQMTLKTIADTDGDVDVDTDTDADGEDFEHRGISDNYYFDTIIGDDFKPIGAINTYSTATTSLTAKSGINGKAGRSFHNKKRKFKQHKLQKQRADGPLGQPDNRHSGKRRPGFSSMLQPANNLDNIYDVIDDSVIDDEDEDEDEDDGIMVASGSGDFGSKHNFAYYATGAIVDHDQDQERLSYNVELTPSSTNNRRKQKSRKFKQQMRRNRKQQMQVSSLDGLVKTPPIPTSATELSGVEFIPNNMSNAYTLSATYMDSSIHDSGQSNSNSNRNSNNFNKKLLKSLTAGTATTTMPPAAVNFQSLLAISPGLSSSASSAARTRGNVKKSEERSRKLLLCEEGGELCHMLFKGHLN